MHGPLVSDLKDLSVAQSCLYVSMCCPESTRGLKPHSCIQDTATSEGGQGQGRGYA